MPGKKGEGKGKKKGKKIFTEPEHVEPFGFRANDLCITPLGVTVTVVGVRYDDPQDPGTARLVMRYPNGYEAVLEPRSLAAVPLTEMGYKRAPECAHVQRDIQRWQAERRAMEEAWERHEATLRLRTEALNLEGGGRKLKGSGPAGMSPAKRPVTAR